MNIEVATLSGASTKEKGDLLENLAEELLKAQGYEVAQELQVTGAELDLLCRHQVNNKEIYVECKAHRDTLSAGVLPTFRYGYSRRVSRRVAYLNRAFR